MGIISIKTMANIYKYKVKFDPYFCPRYIYLKDFVLKVLAEGSFKMAEE